MNKVILIGRIGRTPEMRQTNFGKPFAFFSLATNENWRDQYTGVRQETVEWHNIVCYDRLAEIANDYLTKGSLLAVEGKIKSRKYKDKSGNVCTAYDIIASSLNILSSKSTTASQGVNNANEDEIPF